MMEYMERIKPLKKIFSEGRDQHTKTTSEEVRQFGKHAGELVWLGSGALPQSSYLRLLFQQKNLINDARYNSRIATECLWRSRS